MQSPQASLTIDSAEKVATWPSQMPIWCLGASCPSSSPTYLGQARTNPLTPLLLRRLCRTSLHRSTSRPRLQGSQKKVWTRLVVHQMGLTCFVGSYREKALMPVAQLVQVQRSAWLAATTQAVQGALPAFLGQWLRLPQQRGCRSPCTTLGHLAAALNTNITLCAH